MIASATGLSTSDTREQLFDEIAGKDTERLVAIARSILRDEGEAQDAVQETLVKAWRSWDALASSDHTSRWLTRVCVNHCITRRRYLRSRGWPPLDLIDREGATGDAGSTSPIHLADPRCRPRSRVSPSIAQTACGDNAHLRARLLR